LNLFYKATDREYIIDIGLINKKILFYFILLQKNILFGKVWGSQKRKKD